MDKRLVKRGNALLDKITTYQTVTIRQMSSGHTEEMGYYRYLSNDAVTEGDLCRTACVQTSGHLANRHVLVLGDTTDIDYSRQRGRIKANSGLGHIGNGNGLGYNAHVNLVIDADSETIYGLGDIKLWHRPAKHTAYRQLVNAEKRRNKLKGQSATIALTDAETKELADLADFSVSINGKTYTHSYHVPLAGKESYRWLAGCLNTRNQVKDMGTATFIHDREGDMYDTFVAIPNENNHLLIRSRTNRCILANGLPVKLHDYRHDIAELGHQIIEVRDRKTGKARKAILSLKCAQIQITRGSVNAAYQTEYPETMSAYVVYAEEIAKTVPVGSDPILWCLLTTHPVETLAQAEQITYWYALRWHIEQLFRLIKTNGFNLESSEIETGDALRKLGLLTMHAAIHVLQLKQAREGDETLPIDAVFSGTEVECLSAILPTLEGKTLKQANPFSKLTLPWASWIIARLGGWKGYHNNRPPGIITLRNGLDRFKTIYQGYMLRI
jgi:Transposase DDE domain